VPEQIESLFVQADLRDRLAHFHEFSHRVLSEQPGFPPSSLVISTEFPADAEGADIKIDACAHCLFTSDRSAEAAAVSLLDTWDLDPSLYTAVLHELSPGPLSGSGLYHHAFFGVGYSRTDGCRFNIYLKPAIASPAGDPGTSGGYEDPPVKKTLHISGSHALLAGQPEKSRDPPAAIADLRRSIATAVTYLISRQSPCGQWMDFALPPGPSDAWVTGYVGLSLALLPPEFLVPETQRAIRHATRWCGLAMNPDYGWGYNSTTGSDADSTGHVISFLSAAHSPVPDACYDTLRLFQKEDGGFATYRLDTPDNTWGHSHPDVTPVALRALSTAQEERAVSWQAALDYVRSGQDRTGIWQSYWWNTFFYGTWANLSFLEKTKSEYRKDDCRRFLATRPLPGDPFPLALFAGCLHLVSPVPGYSLSRLIRVFDRLMEMQTADGSWISRPALRLTNDRMTRPWMQPCSGELFADGQHLFTTATALKVLVPFYHQLVAVSTDPPGPDGLRT
jgi:hypothetical protein